MGGRGGSSASAHGVLGEAIDVFTHGQYSAIRDAAKGESGSWISSKDQEYAKALMAAVEKGGAPIDLTRTETRKNGNIPAVGDSIDFTLSSASTRKDWAKAIAKESVVGMGANINAEDYDEQLRAPVVAYSIKGQTKYVKANSRDYASQKEAIFSGKYKVAKVSKETFDTGIVVAKAENRITPKQYAKKYGMAISTFTSKKGTAMYQIGENGKPGSKTYPVGSTILDGYKPVTLKRDIYHVELSKR